MPGKLQLVTADRTGTVVLWDLRAAILAGKDLTVENAQTPDQLWNTLSAPNPVAAYRAGLSLSDRHLLIAQAQTLSPVVKSELLAGAQRIQSLIVALSSPIVTDREKAHKELEGLGSAAIGQVRLALESHPDGELAERLASIAHVIGADDPTIPTPTGVTKSEPVDDPQTLRTARVIQLLEWSADGGAKEEIVRLTRKHGEPGTQPVR